MEQIRKLMAGPPAQFSEVARISTRLAWRQIGLGIVFMSGLLGLIWFCPHPVFNHIQEEHTRLLKSKGPEAAAIAILFLCLLINGGFEYIYWSRATSNLTEPLHEADAALGEEIRVSRYIQNDCKPGFERIWELLRIKRLHHYYILVTTTSYQYTLLRTTQLATFLAGGAGVFLLQTGWAGASPMLRALFLAGGALAAYCSVSTKLLRHDANIAAQLQSYQAYTLLLNDCARFAATGPLPAATTKPEAAVSQPDEDFLRSLYQRMAQIPVAAFGLDPAQIGSPAELAKRLATIS